MQKQAVKQSRKKRTEDVKCVTGMGGRFRVNVVNPDGSIAGDSGWAKNVLTNVGVNQGVLGQFMGLTASLGRPNFFALGSGNTSINVTATALPGSITLAQMSSVTTATSGRTASSDGATARYTATFSSNNFGNSTTVGCAGLYFTTSGASTTNLVCGATFASSTVATNQAINCTYEVVFSATVSNN